MTPVMWIGGVSAIFLLLGIGLMSVGLRGRRVGDHPYCRRCGFDLFGKPDSTPRCGECGADLQRPRATVIGQRRRRVFPLILGVLFCLAGLGVGIGGGVAQARGVNWTAHKPLWWLLRDATSSDVAVRDAARDLIFERQMFKQWTPAQHKALIEFALAHQADRATPFDKYWGTLIEMEMLFAADQITSEQVERYIRQAFGPIQIRTRPRVRRGDPLPIAFDFAGNRFSGEQAGAVLLTDAAHRTLSIDGIPVTATTGGQLRLFGEIPSGRLSTTVDLSAVLDRLPDGPHTLKIRQVFEGGGGPGAAYSRQGSKEWKAMFERVEEATLQFELLPATQPSVRGQNDPAVRTMIETFIATGQPFLKYGINLDLSFGPHKMDAPETPNTSNVAVCMKLFVRHRDREWPMPDFNWMPGENGPQYNFPGKLPGLPASADTIDLVLRPNPAALVKTVDAVDYFEGEIIIPNVPLRRFPPPPRVTTKPARP